MKQLLLAATALLLVSIAHSAPEADCTGTMKIYQSGTPAWTCGSDCASGDCETTFELNGDSCTCGGILCCDIYLNLGQAEAHGYCGDDNPDCGDEGDCERCRTEHTNGSTTYWGECGGCPKLPGGH